MENTKHILLVDDDERNIFALSAYLKARKFKVSTAKDGQECLDKLKESTYDIILLDMMMPILDGFQTLTIIRQDPALRGNKIIALTALAMKGDRERCIEVGADDYCTKPVDIDVLLEKIDKVLAK